MERVRRVWDPIREVWERIRGFFHDVVVEFRKVSWPSRREVMGSTTVVIVVVLVLAVFLFAVDQLFSWAVQGLFKLVGFRS
jgi:preprotein translocase subunit SecE